MISRILDALAAFARRFAASRIYRHLLGIAGTFAVLALVVAIGSAFAFVALAEEVVVEREFDAINREIMLFAHSLSSPAMTTVAFGFTHLGSVLGIVIMTTLLGGWLLGRRKIIDTITLVAIIGGGGILSYFLKLAYRNARPEIIPRLAEELTFSFPSGHTLISFCFWGFVGSWLVLQAPREAWRWLAGLACLVIATMTGLSRVYIGVHWPTDVIAGFLVATFWVSMCLFVEHGLLRRTRSAEGAADASVTPVAEVSGFANGGAEVSGFANGGAEVKRQKVKGKRSD